MHSNPIPEGSASDTPWLLACLAATLFMTGLIWFVQVVHYPLFGRVGRADFSAYHAEHSRLTTLVVVLPMLLELVTSAVLVLWPHSAQETWMTRGGLVLVVIAWLSTFFLQVPEHGHLGAGFIEPSHRRLVVGNWLRTAAWTGHSALLLHMVANRLSR